MNPTITNGRPQPPSITKSIEEIRKGLSLLYKSGDIIELRVPRNPKETYSSTRSGFFDDLDELARAAHKENKRNSVFMTLNPLRRDWQKVDNRVYNKKAVNHDLKKSGQTPESSSQLKMRTDKTTGEQCFTLRTSDNEDILGRRWILIDIDAGQPSATNSSVEEKAVALELATRVMDYLKARGFPVGLLCDGWIFCFD